MFTLHTNPPTLTGDNGEAKRQEIKHYFHKTCDLFEALFEMLDGDEVFYMKSEPTRHPMIFYFGHTAVFFINKLIVAQVIEARINPELEAMFAVGVDEMTWDDLSGEHYRWPTVAEVRVYRHQVRTLVEGLIDTLPMSLPIHDDDPFWVILMGIEHERIHIETSSVLHRQMPIEYIRCIDTFPRCHSSADAPQNSMVTIEGAAVTLGKAHDYHLYGWDNEYGHAVVDVADMKVSKYLVSNGEFMAFVQAGGYENACYWDEEGQKFLAISKAKHPTFWIADAKGGYRYRTLMEEIAMPYDWPVDVNALEAMAFLRWKGEKEGKTYALPSEAQWYRLYAYAGLEDVPVFDDACANINLRHFVSSCPVNEFAFKELYDVVGNVWQWTCTPIEGFEGFAPHPVYDDFSVPTFDGKHNLMKGGSWISTGNEMMKHARYAFRRHFYQHAGFRYVEGATPVQLEVEEDFYESDDAVAQYCEFQYGQEYFGVKNFARHCVEIALEYCDKEQMQRALDIGCATGRASFELARLFDEVTGIDFSARFIQVGVRLQSSGAISYARIEEGEISSAQHCSLEALELQEYAHKVAFWQGDACNLKPHIAGYDLILATNLIDRLYEPRRFLDTLYERMNEGGVLVLTSPYTWLSEYTQKEQWLGGYIDEKGDAVHTIDALAKTFEGRFKRIGLHDVEFVIRETARKYQHSVAQLSVWKRL